MVNHFKKLCANKQSMREVVIDGKEWTLCTITKDDVVAEAGGYPRAQYQSLPLMEKNNTYNYGFDLMFHDWNVDDGYTSFHDIHGRHVSALNLSCHIFGDTFEAVIKNKPGTKVTERHTMKWIHHHPYEFRFKVHIDTDSSGYINCKVNGQEWFNYNGPTMFEGDNNPYWKVGPYIAKWDERHKTDVRKLLVRA